MALQSYNKQAEKQQACLIVFPECSPNLLKVTASRAQWQIKNEVFHFKKIFTLTRASLSNISKKDGVGGANPSTPSSIS